MDQDARRHAGTLPRTATVPGAMRVAAIILAAGAGTRFGGAVKQLHSIGGTPMLERVLAAVQAAGIEERIVVLGANADAVRRSVDLHGARAVDAALWADGQAASLRAGLEATDADAALIVLGDGPGLDPEAVRRLASCNRPAAADYGAGRSHPVLLPRAMWDTLPSAGEAPGRGIPVDLVDCRDLQRPGDVDRPPADQPPARS